MEGVCLVGVMKASDRSAPRGREWVAHVKRVLVAALATLAFAPSALAFDLGVASGDVRPTRAVLWTRADRAGPVTLEVWGPGVPSRRLDLLARLAEDLTVSVRVDRLRPGTEYRYRFRQNGRVSQTGRFRTAPTPDEDVPVRFAWSGDSDGTIDSETGRPAYGGFEVLEAAAAEQPAFFVYLGDTIYADSSFGAPAITLGQYRAKYRQNRAISSLRALEAEVPIIAQWDDHEVLNDWHPARVLRHRRADGLRAFQEYQPLAPRRGEPLYRSFRWGKHVEIFVLDLRSYRSADAGAACRNPPGSGAFDVAPLLPQTVRDQYEAIAAQLGLPVPESCLVKLLDPSRSLLGDLQKEWLKRRLARSTATWKVIFTPDPIQELHLRPYDRWEGYPAERAEILAYILGTGIKNVVWLAADKHATVVKEVTLNGQPTGMIEVVTGPIGAGTAGLEAAAAEDAFLKSLGARCVELDEFSYGVVSAGPKHLTVDSRDAEGRSVSGGPLRIPAR